MSAPTSTRPDTDRRAGRDWRDLAVCRQVDPDLFFVDSESPRERRRQVAIAKSVCAVCPVRAECLAFALDALPDGVAGGMTPRERHEHAARLGRRPGDGWPGELLVGVTRTQLAAAGRAELRAGRPIRAVARAFRVSETTATRWAEQVRAESTVRTSTTRTSTTGASQPAGSVGTAPGRGAA